MLALILAVSSMSSVNCEEIVATLREYQEISDISEQDVERLAGRCSRYLELQEDREDVEDSGREE